MRTIHAARLSLLSASALLLLAVSFYPGHARAEQAVKMIGSMQVEVLTDALMEGEASVLSADAALKEQYLPSGSFPLPVNTVLVRRGERVMLIDSGLGRQLVEQLAEREIKPENVDVILLTHMHFDHIEGLTHEGKAVFPNAVLYVSEREKNYWSDSANIAAYPEDVRPSVESGFVKAQAVFAAYNGRVETFVPHELETAMGDVVPGVDAIAAYGHTPGHTIFMLHDKTDKALVLGDVFHAGVIQFPHPEVSLIFDVDQEEAAKTRRIVFAFAKDNALPVAGMHQIDPVWGVLEESPDQGTAYTFSPSEK